MEVEAEDVAVMNYTLVETLTSRQGAELKAALARTLARLKYLGMEVRRVHSDGVAEMLGSSDGEARGINTLIRSSGEGEELWPLMAKHIGERRGRLQLQALGFETPKMLPWRRKVMVTTKGWDDLEDAKETRFGPRRRSGDELDKWRTPRRDRQGQVCEDR